VQGRPDSVQFFSAVLLLNLYFPPDTSATAKMARRGGCYSICHDVTVRAGGLLRSLRSDARGGRTERSSPPRAARAYSRRSTDLRDRHEKGVVNLSQAMVWLAIPRELFAPCT